MTVPIVEQIAQKLRTRVASLAPANELTPGQVSIVLPNRPVPSGVTLSVQQQQLVRRPVNDFQGNPPATAYAVTFLVTATLTRSLDESAYATACNQIAHELVQAIANPALLPLWFSWDGLAIDTDIGGYIPMSIEQGPNGGVSLPVTVLFRVSENNHSELR
jgi:hypothetical protein